MSAALGVVRSWIQNNARNGSKVTWGSQEFVELKPQTVVELEELANKIAFETIKELSEKVILSQLDFAAVPMPPVYAAFKHVNEVLTDAYDAAEKELR